ncbi:serine/threonine-protein kinase 17A isoform X1 [Balaenoptera acutorostrata]|uniref:Serine/threonine-protein kinase 17A isoform X1 n=1 Tax=Balaenoptera acutorostrata TaxID=9767 RepID=A0ABM3TWC7_BALAC|nr:serine/threonine-protein kinase 17A isoform X1 [Balaenoptera acutorostrata]
MIPLERPGSGGSSPAAAPGSGRVGRGLSTPRRLPPPPRGLLTEIRTAVCTEPFQDAYSLSPGRELGRGKFAVVRKCIKKDSGKEFAAKFMRKRRKGQDCRTEIIHEIAVLELAQDDPWVIDLHEVYETPSEMILVLEYAAGGEIFDQCVADREEAFKEKDVQRLMRQILEGVRFLHAHDVVHLDLKAESPTVPAGPEKTEVMILSADPVYPSAKDETSLFLLLHVISHDGLWILPLLRPQNILLTSDSPLGDIKIVDFGLSRVMKNSEELREIMGTPEYVAPEILSYDPISMATDMWSIGVLAYVMLTGVSPFLGDNKQETFLNISQMNLSYSEEEFDVVSESAVDFIKTLLVKKPEDRATAEECLKHPWLMESSVQEPSLKVKGALEEAQALQEGESVPESNSDTQKPETEESVVTEELIVVTSYTLGQCRQSEKEKMEQKAISKRFKFEEPLLQDIPGDFIY